MAYFSVSKMGEVQQVANIANFVPANADDLENKIATQLYDRYGVFANTSIGKNGMAIVSGTKEQAYYVAAVYSDMHLSQYTPPIPNVHKQFSFATSFGRSFAMTGQPNPANTNAGLSLHAA